MKTIRFILLMVLGLMFHQSGIAQEEGLTDYYPIGTKWVTTRVYVLNGNAPAPLRWTSEVVADTVINGKTYRWVDVNVEYYGKNQSLFYETYPDRLHREYGIRQQGDSVYYYGPGSIWYDFVVNEPSSEQLRYNFNWTAGSSHPEFNYKYVIKEGDVKSVIMEDGNPYDVLMYLEYGESTKIFDDYDWTLYNSYPCVIRTIGRVHDCLFEPMYYGRSAPDSRLVSFTRNGQLIFYRPELDITVGISETVGERPRVTSRYDVGGRAIGPSARGLQIERLSDGTVRKIFRR